MRLVMVLGIVMMTLYQLWRVVYMVLALVGLAYVVVMLASHYDLINVFYYIGKNPIPEMCYQGLK